MRTRTPRAPRHRRAVAIGVAILLTTLAPMLVTTTPARAAAGHEQWFVAQINRLRASVGAAPLAVDGNMAALAAGHTGDMITAGQLFHADRLSTGVSGSWAKLGENVGRGGTREVVWRAFVESPTHHANLVDPGFTHVGISVQYDGSGQLWTTQRFVTRPGGAVDDPGRPADPDGAAPVRSTRADAAPRRSPTANPPAPEPDPEPAPPPPSPADPGRVSALLEVLRASPD